MTRLGVAGVSSGFAGLYDGSAGDERDDGGDAQLGARPHEGVHAGPLGDGAGEGEFDGGLAAETGSAKDERPGVRAREALDAGEELETGAVEEHHLAPFGKSEDAEVMHGVGREADVLAIPGIGHVESVGHRDKDIPACGGSQGARLDRGLLA